METINLTEKDLIKEAKNLPIEEVEYYHIRNSSMTTEMFKRADNVIYSTNSGTKMLKNVYGNVGVVPKQQ